MAKIVHHLTSPAGFVIMMTTLFAFATLGDAQGCLSDEKLDGMFDYSNPTCCQFDVCALPCPAPVSDPAFGTWLVVVVVYWMTPDSTPINKIVVDYSLISNTNSGFSIAIIVAIVISFLIGIACIVLVRGKAENYFVAGRSLPLWIMVFTLSGQSLDSNALLGNADLSYQFS